VALADCLHRPDVLLENGDTELPVGSAILVEIDPEHLQELIDLPLEHRNVASCERPLGGGKSYFYRLVDLVHLTVGQSEFRCWVYLIRGLVLDSGFIELLCDVLD
jgi:hypothetical protein